MQDNVCSVTQKELVLAHLKKGRTLTPLTALGEYGVYRLASVIERLRRAGYNISTNIRRSEMQKPYAEYKLVGQEENL